LIIHQAMALVIAWCSLLSGSEAISSIVLFLEAMPMSELILPLNNDFAPH
jgi:hypothetical protein